MSITAFGSIIEHKRGDDWRQRIVTSIAPTADLSAPAGDVRDGTITSEIREPDGTLLATLSSEYISGNAERRVDVVYVADTAEWPIGDYRWDVSFVDWEGIRVTSPTIFIRVVDRVTNV